MEDLTNIYLYFIHNDLIHIFCLFSDQKQYTEGCRRRFGDELYTTVGNKNACYIYKMVA